MEKMSPQLVRFRRKSIFRLSVLMGLIGITIIVYFHMNYTEITEEIKDMWATEFVLIGYSLLFVSIFSLARFIKMTYNERKSWIISYVFISSIVFIYYAVRYYDGKKEETIILVAPAIGQLIATILFFDYEVIPLDNVLDFP